MIKLSIGEARALNALGPGNLNAGLGTKIRELQEGVERAGTVYEATDVVQRSKANPSNNTWYNLGGFSLPSVPPGKYLLTYQVNVEVIWDTANERNVTSIYTTLSTSPSAESDKDLTAKIELRTTGNYIGLMGCHHHRNKIKTLAETTTFYLLSKVSPGATEVMDALENVNNQCTALIRAQRI